MQKSILVISSILLIAFSALFSSCKKEVDVEAIRFGYEYFPTEVGTYRIYLVDSIGHDITSDTARFQIMEVIEDEFTDNIGQPSYSIGRYKRYSNSDDWIFQAVWVEKKTTTFAQRVEDNQRFVRLVFPVKEDQVWDGNAFNTLPAWNYSYSGIGAARLIGPFNFSNTITVNQRNNVNLVDQEIASEIYAADIGLIYKKLIDLNIQEDGLTGIELEMSILSYGQNQ